MKLSDPIEQIIADGLDAAGVRYVHESESKDVTLALDFYLPDFCMFIECKQFWSSNLNNQMQRVSNIIAIQGRAAARSFVALLAQRIEHEPSKLGVEGSNPSERTRHKNVAGGPACPTCGFRILPPKTPRIAPFEGLDDPAEQMRELYDKQTAVPPAIQQHAESKGLDQL